MKNNLLTSVLVGILCVIVLGNVFFLFRYNRVVHQLQEIAPRVQLVSGDRFYLDALAGEVIEYSKKDNAVDPILQSFGLKPGGKTTASTPRPATK